MKKCDSPREFLKTGNESKALCAFHWRFLSRAGIVMLVQYELSKIQVNCEATESEKKTESIMI